MSRAGVTQNLINVALGAPLALVPNREGPKDLGECRTEIVVYVRYRRIGVVEMSDNVEDYWGEEIVWLERMRVVVDM